MAMKVLVVEDNDDVRAIVVEVLRMDAGIILFEAVNGSDAVDTAGRERPHVVVTDIMMPQAPLDHPGQVFDCDFLLVHTISA